MSYFKKVFEFTEKDKERYIEVSGKIMLGIAERRHILDIAKSVDLEPWQVQHNIDKILYDIRKCYGLRRYIKAMFIK